MLTWPGPPAPRLPLTAAVPQLMTTLIADPPPKPKTAKPFTPLPGPAAPRTLAMVVPAAEAPGADRSMAPAASGTMATAPITVLFTRFRTEPRIDVRMPHPSIDVSAGPCPRRKADLTGQAAT